MKALERMEKVERPDDAPKGIGFSFRAGIESGNDVLSVKELSMGFGQNTLFSGVSFDVKKLNIKQLTVLASEIRDALLTKLSRHGGLHL